MASGASFDDICAVCLDTRPLKIVGRCKHRFCSECILITLGSQEGDVFACPTCKVDCPRPWDGVKGMVDFTGEDVPVIDTVVGALQRGGREELQPRGRGRAGAEADHLPKEGRGARNRKKKKRNRNKADLAMKVECMICYHKKKNVQAVNLCIECGNLYICEECTKVHARNKATQRHVVVHLKSVRMCGHGCLLNSYCRDCGEAVCMVCVMIVHGEHTVEKLADVVDQKIAELKVILEKKAGKLERVKGIKKDLALLKLIVPRVDKQDILIKEIEDHAQMCFEQITKWKEALKDQVKASYKVIMEIPVGFEKVSEMVEELQEPTERARRLLTETEYDPEYLEKLIALQQELDALVHEVGDIEEEEYGKQLCELHRKHYTIFSEEIPETVRGLDSADGEEYTDGEEDGDEEEYTDGEEDANYAEGYREIFQKTLQVASEDMFIPCTANLGQMFAVAHPTRLWEPSTAIDIYELPCTLSTTIGIYEIPGTLKHTFTAHVPPLYDMSSTPDGKLAVLSNGTGGTDCSVKLFDPDAGYICSTHDIDIAKPLSLGVTLQHQYVILGENKLGSSVITVVDKTGVVEHALTIDNDFIIKYSDQEASDMSDVDSDDNLMDSDQDILVSDVDSDTNATNGTQSYSDAAHADSNTGLDADSIDAVDIPKRISCGGRFIFITGEQILAVYEITETGIHVRRIDEIPLDGECTDIAATIWDDYFLFINGTDCVWLQEWVMDDLSKSEWYFKDWGFVFDQKIGDERPAMASIRDGNIVVCQGQTIRVYKTHISTHLVSRNVDVDNFMMGVL